MKRSKFLFSAGLSVASLALLRNKSFSAAFADPAYQIKTLRGNMGIFTEKGGTIAWLINKEGIVVVDAEFPEQATN